MHFVITQHNFVISQSRSFEGKNVVKRPLWKKFVLCDSAVRDVSAVEASCRLARAVQRVVIFVAK
jgi:hypothetical protein